MSTVVIDPNINISNKEIITQAGFNIITNDNDNNSDDVIYIGEYDFISNKNPSQCIWYQQHHNTTYTIEACRLPHNRAGHSHQLLGLLNIIKSGKEAREKVLLLLSRKKLDRMCPMGVYDSTEDLEYICIDPSCDIKEQVSGFEKCLLLDKITDWIASSPKVVEGVRKINNPEVCSIDSQMTCTDRWDLQQAFISAGVDVPTMHLIEPDQQDIPSLQYPQILKTRLACGTVASHHMAVVSTIDELQRFRQAHLEDAVCAQDFVPHGEVIYKVFAIGPEVRVDIRASLGDDAIGKKFDSQNMKEVVVKEVPSTDSANIDMKKVKDIAGRVDKKLGLGLFGLDIIIGSDNGKYYVVDVNYFPTYKGVDGLSELMRNLLLNKMN